MIKCTSQDIEELFDYIGQDFGRCAYLYIDLKKYGLDNPNIEMWKQLDADNRICVIALRYYNGMHIFSQGNVFDEADVQNLITAVRPSLVCGMQKTLQRFENKIPGYEHECGYVVQMGTFTGITEPLAHRAQRDELKEIVELLMTDENMGGPYTFDLLYKQFCERYDEGFGRSWVRKDEKGVVSHSGTYAELDDIAVLSGGIVRPDCRGHRLYNYIMGSICKELIEEGKTVISYHYGGSAKYAHDAVGFEELGAWEKLILVEE